MPSFRSACLRLLPMAGAALLLLAACSDESATPSATALDSSAIQEDTTFDASLAQILQRRERFRTFATMLDSARLLSTLRRGGPYTVFAATNPGLDKLPEGLVDELLLPANRDRLRQVVAYHLHRGQISKDSLRGINSISTLTGQTLPVSVEGGRVLIGGERVSEYAITGTNGRIFAFDALVIPPVGGATQSLPSGGTYDTLGADDGAGQSVSGDGENGNGGNGNGNAGKGN